MKKFYCELKDNKLQVFVQSNDGRKKIINNNDEDIITVINYLLKSDSVLKLSDENTENLEISCEEKNITLIILGYKHVLAYNNNIKEGITELSNEAFVKSNPSVSYTKPKRNKTEYVVSRLIPLVLAGGITVFSFLYNGGQSKAKTKPEVINKPSDTYSFQTIDINPHTVPHIEFTDNLASLEKEEKEIQQNRKPLFHDEKENTLTETSGNDENTKNKPVKLDVETEKEFLKSYFNVSDAGMVDEFLNEFVKTMLGYNKEYTLDELIDIFYETAQVPLEEKIEIVKNAFNLDDEQLDAVAATLVGEGVGGGLKYIDVYAATTTALNHLQYPAWVNDIVRARGEELGHSLYGHTCYKYQFNAYDSSLYYNFLGDRSLTGYTSVIDTLYNNYVYGLILHNYTQFRGAWIDVPNGKLFESGGNKYLDERRPEDRVVPEINEKNNSI